MLQPPRRTPDNRPVDRRTRLIRFLQTAFLLVSLGAVALVHSPWLPVSAQALGHGVTNAIGQEVRWSMFAYDPRGFWATLEAEIQSADGSESDWVLDLEGDHGYREYKWLESAALEGPDAFVPLGEWLAEDPSVESVRIWLHRHQVRSPDGEEDVVASVVVYPTGPNPR